MRQGTSIAPFQSIPPEIFAHITSFIPLHLGPKILLSLVLGNRRFYDIFYPILYSRLVLRNEDDAIMVFQRILSEEHLGLSVTQIHLMSELSLETRHCAKPFDVLVGLEAMVKNRRLPRLATLNIHLLKGWHYDKHWRLIWGHGRLTVDFWRTLRTECPRLRGLTLRNVGHGPTDTWLSGSVIDEINCFTDLSSLRLEFPGSMTGPPAEEVLRIINNLPRLASTLHTLSIGGELTNGISFFLLDFPNLKWLRLHHFTSGHEAHNSMQFFERHPQLESLTLSDCHNAWFVTDFKGSFLPKLKHLKVGELISIFSSFGDQFVLQAGFEDIRRLVHILPQLISLAFVNSYNAQVPYLLRSVLPHGLPSLKSLEIQQSSVGWDSRKLEGVLWYETLDGKFQLATTKKRMPRNLTNEYVYSIVRGAPNLEEFGLQGMYFRSEHLRALAPPLTELSKLERLYFYSFSPHPRVSNMIPEEDHLMLISDFLSGAESLGRACARLDSVTSISGTHLPYLSGIVQRNPDGGVIGIKQCEGFGMQLSTHEDDPFPCYP
ncbi:hypothetical protein BDN70DRAFT_872905 [Pholiota conissans]|uniref:F-box domain-containing protein n=1 Tax=Pholiota conissans TaxID=109636 RepID=A0A9P5ZAP4_9AGAR|nr:hypothetical protein BDN70DRAFT_872905 [Pholiota conissans]